MPREIKCPHCGHGFEPAEDVFAVDGECPVCGKIIAEPHASPRMSELDAPPVRSVSTMIVVGWLFAAAAIVSVCAGLWFVFLQPSVHAARLSACMGNGAFLGLAFHNHHDVHERLPLASSEPVTGITGKGDLPNPAGYSWTVALLPFLEEQPFYEQIKEQSDDFRIPPFDPQMTELHSEEYPGCVEVTVLRCRQEPTPGRVAAEDSDYREYPTQTGAAPPAISNYMVLPASHRLNFHGPAELPVTNPDSKFVGNGVIVFPKESQQNLHAGLRFRDITDGTSNTVLLCETREPAYAAWIDGQVTWGVGAWPQNISVPSTRHTADRLLGWPDSDTGSITSLQAAQYESGTYLQASQFGARHDRRCGPSSDHPRGVVVHAFADGHVSVISPDIDRNLYLRLITRAGNETIKDENNW